MTSRTRSSNFPIIDTNEDGFKASNPGNYVDLWTEIVIQATPAKVRAVFLDFENRPSWDPFYRQMKVAKGQIDDLSTKPAISITVDEKCDGQKNFKLPFTLEVMKNDEEGIVWGCKLLGGCFLLVDHVHLFQPVDDGKATKLLNYERQTGCLSYLTNTTTFTKAFQLSNEGLKRVCEKETN